MWCLWCLCHVLCGVCGVWVSGVWYMCNAMHVRGVWGYGMRGVCGV